MRLLNKFIGLSLFSNVGIAETYFDEIGIDIVLANEIEEKRCMFFSFQYPQTEMIVGDIRNQEIQNKICQLSKAKGVDFIMATPPCQGMSSVGKMDPFDPRNHLITNTIDIILNIKPKYVFLENVAAMEIF